MYLSTDALSTKNSLMLVSVARSSLYRVVASGMSLPWDTNLSAARLIAPPMPSGAPLPCPASENLCGFPFQCIFIYAGQLFLIVAN